MKQKIGWLVASCLLAVGVLAAGLASLAGLTPAVAAAQGGEWLQLSGHIGGTVHALAIDGTHVIAGVGPELAVMDVSNPAAPMRLGYALLPERPQAIQLLGNLAYVAAGGAGLYIVNVSNPAAPFVVGSYNTPGFANSLDVVGPFVYVADGVGGVQVILVVNPASPTLLTHIATPSGASGVVVENQVAYVAATTTGVHLYNVNNPSTPTALGHYDTPGYAWDLTLQGDLVYVADGFYGGLRLVNVNNPNEPFEVGAYNTPGASWHVNVQDGVAYVADGPAGVRLISVTVPAAPVEVGVLAAPDSADSSAISGTVLYVAGWQAGLQVASTADLTAPVEIGRYTVPANVNHGLATAGAYGYVASESSLHVVETDTPLPAVVGSVTFTDSIEAIALAGDYAYLANGHAGLRIVHLLTPTQPVSLSLIDTPGIARGVAITGHFALVADLFGGLRVIDVSDPADPAEVGFSIVAEEARRVVVQGPFVYVAGGADGLYVFRLFEGGYLNLWGVWPSPTTVQDVAVAGDYAYLAAGDGGLYVLDITNPAAPTLVGALNTFGYGTGVAVAGSFVYLADGGQGLRVIDVSNPAAPLERYFYDTPGLAVEVALSGSRVLLANQDWGVYIFSGLQTISGRIADWYGAPFAGITVTAESGGPSPAQAQTDAGGFYTLTGMLPGWLYPIRPESPGFAFQPALRVAHAPATWLNFTILPGPVSNMITPEEGGTLLFTDTLGLITWLDFPPGVVTETATIYLTPTLAGSAGNLAFAGHAFEVGPGPLQFSLPVTATIWYTDSDVGLVLDEEELTLQWWNDDGWQEAAESCDPPSVYGRFIESNELRLAICRAGRFALFGPTHNLSLPIINLTIFNW